MQMAQRKRQHEREEASEQEGEDEEYSEEEEEEYFEEGEEEERSQTLSLGGGEDPKKEASESDSDDSRDYWRPPPPPQQCSPGFWIGHSHRLDICGAAVVGRWIHAKNSVWQEGEWSSPLPKLFRAGGRRPSQSVQAAVLTIPPPATPDSSRESTGQPQPAL